MSQNHLSIMMIIIIIRAKEKFVEHKDDFVKKQAFQVLHYIHKVFN